MDEVRRSSPVLWRTASWFALVLTVTLSAVALITWPTVKHRGVPGTVTVTSHKCDGVCRTRVRFISDDDSTKCSDVESMTSGTVGEVRRGVYIPGGGAQGKVHGTDEPLWFWTAACFLPLSATFFGFSVRSLLRAKRGARRISISDFNRQERFTIAFGIFIWAGGVLFVTLPGPPATQEMAFLRGEGISGIVTVTKKHEFPDEGLIAVGDYHSNDGRYNFTGINFDRDSFTVGNSYPGMYMGSGERPELIYAPVADPSFLRRSAIALYPAAPAGGTALAACFILSAIRDNRERLE